MRTGRGKERGKKEGKRGGKRKRVQKKRWREGESRRRSGRGRQEREEKEMEMEEREDWILGQVPRCPVPRLGASPPPGLASLPGSLRRQTVGAVLPCRSTLPLPVLGSFEILERQGLLCLLQPTFEDVQGGLGRREGSD